MLRAKIEWFRRERTLRAANKLGEALERFRVLSAMDNFGGAQLVRLSLAEDLCRELGETQAARALSARAEIAEKSNEEALAQLESYRRKRRPRVTQRHEGEAEKEAGANAPTVQPIRRARQRATTAAAAAAK